MSRADYAHWNEEADIMWWLEEGKHAEDDAISAWENRDDEDYDRGEDDEVECPGHPHPTKGETEYCDGSCI